MMSWAKLAVVLVVMNFLVHNRNGYYTTTKGIIFCGTGERNGGYDLNKAERSQCRAPTFSLFALSHAGISPCAC